MEQPQYLSPADTDDEFLDSLDPYHRAYFFRLVKEHAAVRQGSVLSSDVALLRMVVSYSQREKNLWDLANAAHATGQPVAHLAYLRAAMAAARQCTSAMSAAGLTGNDRAVQGSKRAQRAAVSTGNGNLGGDDKWAILHQ